MGAAFKTDDFCITGFDPQSMATRLMQFAPATDAEALKLLRASFPDCPLSARVAALDFLMRKRPRSFGVPYRPI